MRLALVLGFGFLLSSSLLSAQYEKPAPQDGAAVVQMEILVQHPDGTSTTTSVQPPAPPMCPVAMQAKQGTGNGLIKVREGHSSPPPSSGPSQRIHLVLMRGRAAQVIAAKVRVRGLSGKNRMQQTEGINGPSPDRTVTFNAKFAPESNTSVAADLVLAGFTSVETIDLLSITYNDGSTWKMASRNACRVTPDPMMLIAGR